MKIFGDNDRIKNKSLRYKSKSFESVVYLNEGSLDCI